MNVDQSKIKCTFQNDQQITASIIYYLVVFIIVLYCEYFENSS